MKTNLSFGMLRLGCLALLCTTAAPLLVTVTANATAATMPTPLDAPPAREITVGTRWPQLIATNGKVFRNVKFTFVSPREVRFMHTDGIGSLPLNQVVVPGDVVLPLLDQMAPELTMGPLGSMMTPQERQVSGIDKLSNDEQATLAEWVRNTVQDQMKAELERRGLPPTWTALPGSSSMGDAGLGLNPASGTLPAAGMAGTTPGLRDAALPASATVRVPSPQVPAQAQAHLGRGQAWAFASTPALLPPAGGLRQPQTLAQVSTGRRVRGSIGVVESSIDGEFQGLGSGRSYRLANGQTWQQQEGFAQGHMAFKPRVTIYPVNDGAGWMMAVDGVSHPVRVVPLD